MPGCAPVTWTHPQAHGHQPATCPAPVRSSQYDQCSVTSPLTEVTIGGGGQQRDVPLWGGVLEAVVGHRGSGGTQGWNVASQTSQFTSTPWVPISKARATLPVEVGHEVWGAQRGSRAEPRYRCLQASVACGHCPVWASVSLSLKFGH